MKQLEADKAKLQTIAERATEEAEKLRATLEQATKEYESELAALRERRDAVQERCRFPRSSSTRRTGRTARS